MALRFIFIVTLFYLISCNSGEASASKSNSDTSAKAHKTKNLSSLTVDTTKKFTFTVNKADSPKSKLKGAWTDGSFEGATLCTQRNMDNQNSGDLKVRCGYINIVKILLSSKPNNEVFINLWITAIGNFLN